MIVVYGGWPTRAVRVVWLLEELGLAYEVRPVDIRKRDENPQFMAINPAGFLPAIEDGAVRMVESVAIMQYLLARYGPGGLAPPVTDETYPAYQQFMFLGEAGLAAMLNIIVASRFFAPEAERANFGAAMAERMFFNRLGLVTGRLETAPFVAADQFTAADISVTYALELAERVGLGDKFPPLIKPYLERVRARDAYQRTMAALPQRAL